ncbi:MAG: hypothetical protein TUN42_04245 [Dehalogenimonas sp.]
MAIYSYTLDQLVERICRLYLHDFREGMTTGSGSNATLVDINRTERDDFFNNLPGSQVYIRSGTYAGSLRTITDWANSSGTLTFAPVVGGTIATSVSYSIHCSYPRDDVVEAINQAIDVVAEEALVWLSPNESTITLVADTYEYALPTNFLVITRVTMADADGYFYDAEIPASQYRIIRSGAPKLHLLKEITSSPDTGWFHQFYQNGNFDVTAGRKLRIEGLGSQATLTSDSDTCSIAPSFICAQAAALLHASRIARAENDPEMHQVQFQTMQAIADRERTKVVGAKVPRDAKRVME